MLQAMNTGHDGSMSTVHANSPRDALYRVENMVMMANLSLPLRAIRTQIASAVNLVVHIERMRDGVRRVQSVAEMPEWKARSYRSESFSPSTIAAIPATVMLTETSNRLGRGPISRFGRHTTASIEN